MTVEPDKSLEALNYPSRLSSPKPTTHSRWIFAAYGMFIVELVYHSTIVILIYRTHAASPIYWFDAHVYDLRRLSLYGDLLLAVGGCCACIACLRPNRKRWAAVLALSIYSFSFCSWWIAPHRTLGL